MIRSGSSILKLFIIGMLFLAPFFYIGTAFSEVSTDESPAARGDGKVSNGTLSLPAKDPLNPDHVAAIKKVAVYLDKMGRKDLAASLPTDFENGKIYVDKLGMGVNAEVQLTPPRRLAISDETIQQLDSDDGRALNAWALTFVHEDVHMKQLLPTGYSLHETPAWCATLKENGLWIRNTLDEIDQVDSNTTLSPDERGERLQELNALLVDQYSDFGSTLNDIRGMTAEGKLNKDNEWQGLPPAGSIEASGTTDLEAIGKYAEFQVKAGQQIAMPYVKISPRPGTAKTNDNIKLETKLFNMPALNQIRYLWKVSLNGSVVIDMFKGESLSYTVDKPGQWTMSVSVHAKGKNNRPIAVRAEKSFLEDSITINVEAAQPYVKIEPRPGTAKPGDKIQLAAKLYNMPEDLTQAPRYNWIISRGDKQIAWPKEESLSYVVDKPGQWRMQIFVQARDKNRILIKGKAGDRELEDSITIKVEEAPVAPPTGGAWQTIMVCNSTPRDCDIGVDIWNGEYGYSLNKLADPPSVACWLGKVKPGRLRLDIRASRGKYGNSDPNSPDFFEQNKYSVWVDVVAGGSNKWSFGWNPPK